MVKDNRIEMPSTGSRNDDGRNSDGRDGACVSTNYKQTEIGLIPEDWELINLGDSFNFKNGLNKEKEFFGYGFPIVNYMDVYKNTFITTENFKGKVFVSKQELRNFEVTLGDVLFTRTSETQEEIGYSAVIIDDLKDTVFSGFVLRARPFNNKFNLEFCRFCFSNRQVREQVISNATYTTRALTNGRVLSKIKIPLPPLAEQEAIATALSDCDSWIDSIEQVLAKKRLIKQGAMQELLTPKEDWEVKTVDDVCIVLNNLRIPVKESSRTKGDIPYYGANGIQGYVEGFTHQGEFVLVAEDGANDLKNYPINYVNGKIWVNNHAHVLQGVQSILSTRFLSYLLKSIDFQSVLVGGTRAKLNKSILLKVQLSYPSLSEQTRIATILSDMDLEIEALEEKLGKARQIKQGMMQELLTGRVRLV